MKKCILISCLLYTSILFSSEQKSNTPEPGTSPLKTTDIAPTAKILKPKKKFKFVKIEDMSIKIILDFQALKYTAYFRTNPEIYLKRLHWHSCIKGGCACPSNFHSMEKYGEKISKIQLSLLRMAMHRAMTQSIDTAAQKRRYKYSYAEWIQRGKELTLKKHTL